MGIPLYLGFPPSAQGAVNRRSDAIPLKSGTNVGVRYMRRTETLGNLALAGNT